MSDSISYVAHSEPNRNDPGPCGSGKKDDQCCMLKPDNPWHAAKAKAQQQDYPGTVPLPVIPANPASPLPKSMARSHARWPT